MTQARDNYWSMLKGIAILAVLMIHIPLTSDTNSILATRQIINFPVAMFLFLSGFFVKRDGNTWVSTKRLLIPYLIWSGFWCIIIPPQSITLMLLNFVTGGYSILYFLFVLIQLKLLTPFLLSRLTNNDYDSRKDWMWLVTPLYLLLFSVIRVLFGKDFERVNGLIAFDNFFPSWLVYYYMGLFCKFHKVKIRFSYLAILALSAVFLSVLVAFWLYENNCVYNFPYTQSKITSMLYALSVILLFYSLHEDNMSPNVLTRLGEMSFGIYILHLPIKYFLCKAIEITHFSVGLPLCQIPLLMFTLVLIITILTLVIVYKIFPKKYVRLLGLQ